MATPDLTASRSVSGHVKLRRGKLRSTYYAKWRDAEGIHHERKLGQAWQDKGAPPSGYLRPKDAEAALQEILVAARRGASEQRRTGVTFDVVAEDWLAWGLRDRDWKPSTLSDNRSNVYAHLVPAFGAKRIERITVGRCRWPEQVRDLLKAHRKLVSSDRSELPFPGERGEYLDGSALRRRHKKTLTTAKLRPLRFHDLRHTFGSIAIDQATIIQVQAWMGHADVQTTMKYMHHRSRAGDARLLSAAFRPKVQVAKKRRPRRKATAT